MARERPNIIVIYTDDLGYGDLSCMGDTHVETPHLDELAASGVRFTDWYSNCAVCSGSRAALMTGQYPDHAGVNGVLPSDRESEGLPDSKRQNTIAHALGEEGYRTALFGKWHLGVTPRSMPHHFGFQQWFGHLSGCIDYYSHLFYYMQNRGVDPLHDLWENGEEIWRNGEYMTEMITEHSVDYIHECARDSAPFFLYTSYNAPHYPMHAPQEYVDRFDHLPWDRQIMAAMIAGVDDGVGRIIQSLEAEGIRDNTFIFFSSDNGPSRETRNWMDGTKDLYYGGTTGGLRGHKGSLFDGGIREPAIMSWPGTIGGGQVSSEVGIMMDIFPTMLDAVGGDPSRYDLDGVSLLDMVCNGGENPHDWIAWHLGGQTAIRRGDWKLVLNGGERYLEGPVPEVWLSKITEDFSESNNLADEAPEEVWYLREILDPWAEEQKRLISQQRAEFDARNW